MCCLLILLGADISMQVVDKQDVSKGQGKVHTLERECLNVPHTAACTPSFFRLLSNHFPNHQFSHPQKFTTSL